MTPHATDTDKPLVSLELITYLQRVYPERSPKKGECFEQLRWRGGECAVVEHLIALYKAQKENT